MDGKSRNLGYLTAAVSVFLNTLLFALKFAVGLSVGSIAMVADAWHTLSDTLTSLIVIAGFWISGRPKDRRHPFGHGRAELIASLALGFILGIAGLGFFKESLEILIDRRPPPDFTRFAIGVFAVSAFLKEALALFSIWAGRRINSPALIGDGWHHRSDALASLVIVLGAVFGGGLWWLDGALGLGVSVLIISVAVRLAKNAAYDLLGQEADEKLKGEIGKVIVEIAPEVSKIHHLHFHAYGGHREITVHLHVFGELPLRRAHEISSAIEARLRAELRIEATIHMEPCQDCPQGEEVKCAEMKRCLNGRERAVLP